MPPSALHSVSAISQGSHPLSRHADTAMLARPESPLDLVCIRSLAEALPRLDKPITLFGLVPGLCSLARRSSDEAFAIHLRYLCCSCQMMVASSSSALLLVSTVSSGGRQIVSYSLIIFVPSLRSRWYLSNAGYKSFQSFCLVDPKSSCLPPALTIAHLLLVASSWIPNAAAIPPTSAMHTLGFVIRRPVSNERHHLLVQPGRVLFALSGGDTRMRLVRNLFSCLPGVSSG